MRLETAPLAALVVASCVALGCDERRPARALSDAPPAVPVVRSCEPEPTRGTNDGVRHVRRVGYTWAGDRALHIDLATPATSPPHPIVVVLGARERADRAAHEGAVGAIVARGWAAASVELRPARAKHSRGHAFPGAVADARCAVRWLRAHAPRLGLDADRIVAAGTSTAGHVAAMLATAADVDGLDEKCATPGDARVRAAVAVSAPFDLRPEADIDPIGEQVVSALLGTRRDERPGHAAFASPIVHASEGDAPMLIVHGSAGQGLPSQGRAMERALSRAGVPVTRVVAGGAGRLVPFLGRDPRVREATCTTLAFLERHLDGRGAP